MKPRIRNLTIAALLAISTSAFSDISIITHPSNDASINAKQISKLFLAKSKKFPGGGEAVPIEQSDGSPTRAQFHKSITKKDEAQLKSYWSRIVFTGKGQPPKEVDSDSEVMALISKNPSMIGYVDSSAVDGSVKVVLTSP